MAPVLVFDIETIPDVAGLRRLGAAPDTLTDAEVAQAAFDRRREKTGSDFLPLHLHRVVAIGCLFRDDSAVRVRCLGAPGDDESRLIGDFFRTIEKHTPTLVSWNGSGFDLPVLHYRSLVHGVQAPRYWDMGEDDRDFRFNNYISRYHSRHTDLMDLLALYNGRAAAPLDDLARLCGFPGKLGMDGSQVWPAWREGRIAEIRDYCETDVANTWLVYCRFQLLRGVFTRERYDAEVALLRQSLAALPGAHWQAYLAAWPEAPAP
jgi:predicted PolB exonuclease-like 3'-5' exonuclease